MTVPIEAVGDVVELQVDVSAAVGLGESATTAVSVFLPTPIDLASPPVVLFAFPGAGYGRRYFSLDLPDAEPAGQARYHASRHGWIVVTCDHLGVGDSSLPDLALTTLEVVVAANAATVDHVLDLIHRGALSDQLPPLPDPVVIGLGQSMGGCFTVELQGSRPRFDAIAILGFGAAGSGVPKADGSPFTFTDGPDSSLPQDQKRDDYLAWAFHGPGVPETVVRADIDDFPTRFGRLPEWASATMPGCVAVVTEAGIIADAAAAITVPVFVGVGEVDIVIDPRLEPAAYRSSRDITVYIQTGMAHMHNFAPNRTVLWERLSAWVSGMTSGDAKLGRPQGEVPR